MRFYQFLKYAPLIFAKKMYSMLFLERKYSIILNYHRIGESNFDNPFHRLHTVSFFVFKIHIWFCRFMGSMVSLEEIEKSQLKSKLNFSITFDDVSNSANKAFVWLQKNNIPFTICPCKDITLNGIGWRDKVYFIDKYISSDKIHTQLCSIFS